MSPREFRILLQTKYGEAPDRPVEDRIEERVDNELDELAVADLMDYETAIVRGWQGW